MEPRKPFTEAAGGSPTRREFLHQAAAAAGTVGALTILPGRVFGGQRKLAPSDKLNLGAVGVGGMGGSNLSRCETENIIALCDVDSALAAKTFGKYPNARRYGNYREMFDKEKDLDAVIVATPDHTHAVVAMAAMQRGLHVYVQKPIAHAVWEARLMTETARKHKISSQMGNQGHSGEGLRLISEWVAAGALGQIKEVHAWTNRPVWPQGVEVERPKDTPPVPATMDWDEWIGPAPSRPFHPTYHPGR
ncbi:MAG TPA: Gfo/Idh/MocA family oxidoreductase, partial [Vicinamibacterales bacterium]|nr:Gfo/Idh/MocA family oxidoreductase [Vicinamibacterales bacterium]